MQPSRIDTIRRFTSREQLNQFLDKDKADILIVGGRCVEDGSWFDGYVREIPYGKTIAVKHMKVLYHIRKRTDGVMEVML
jgi:hypothetical protein